MASAKVKRVDLRGKSLDPVELFMKYHVIGLRHTRNGYIRQVKHVQFGWMKPEEYYRLQKIHDLLPIIGKVVEGGYRMKAALWSLEVEAGPVSVPLGLYFPVKGLLLAAGSFDAGDTPSGMMWLLATALPFGDLLIAMQIFKELGGIATAIGVTPPEDAVARAQSNLEFFGSQLGGFFEWLFGAKFLPRPVT